MGLVIQLMGHAGDGVTLQTVGTAAIIAVVVVGWEIRRLVDWQDAAGEE
jgi:hypothetical protein